MDWQPLDFEKPIFELERRLQDLKSHSTKHDVDLGPAVKELEVKLRETRRHVYGNLTAWQRVQIARHTQRPFALDYIQRCFTNWVELHGDRRFADDRAMPCGMAMLGRQRCVVITHQKGRNTKENVMRNFGCAHPQGVALDASRRKIRYAGDFPYRYARRFSRCRIGGAPHF